ncbi:hypothetical protein, partial [Parabacteroides distasonis]
ALLWESILEFKEQNKDCSILLYTNDKIFNEALKTEYADLFEGEEIKIFRPNEESLLIKEIETIAKNIDEYTYIPELVGESQDIIDWLYSNEFKEQFLNYKDSFKVINKYISFNDIEILDIDEIYYGDEIDDPIYEIQVTLSAEVIFDIKGGAQIKDTYDMLIWIHLIEEGVFVVDNIEIEDYEEVYE